MYAPRDLTPKATNPRVQASPLYRWRRRYNQTRAHLSRHTGIGTRTIYDYERGRVLPTPRTLVRLAQALHASPWRLAANVLLHHYEVEEEAVTKEGVLMTGFFALGPIATDYLVDVVRLAGEDRELLLKVAGPLFRQCDAVRKANNKLRGAGSPDAANG